MKGLQFLERSDEDETADQYPARVDDGPVVHFTRRQVEILSGGPEMFKKISYEEGTELGKLLVKAHSQNTDQWLRDRDEDPPKPPDLSEEPFTYNTLSNKNCIRLLRILPDGEDGMMNLHMEEYDLEQHQPLYTCLSYCWGNPHATGNFFDFNKRFADEYSQEVQYPIACDGKLIFVRANLYEALQQLPDSPGLELKTEGDSERRCTLLHAAAQEGNMEAIKLIYLFRGAKLETKDTQGRTALVLAVIAGHHDAVKELLQAGADPGIRDHNGASSLDHALQNDRHEITDTLLTFDRTKAQRYQRKHKHLGDNTLLWIDAICINQADTEEKSYQVAMMDQIYNKANSVIVWLGRDDGYGELAIQAIDKLFPAAYSGTLQTSDVIPFKRQNPVAFTALGVESISMQEWGALAVLYLRQSFKRLWCVQEIVLQRSVSMWVGDQSVPFEEFMIVTAALYKLEYALGLPVSLKFRPGYNASVTSEAYSIYDFRRNGPFNHDLLHMIMNTMTWQCFDPRDHIYAVLGMCRGAKGTDLIKIDYKKSTPSVFTEVMRLMLFQLQDKAPTLELVAYIRDSALKDRDGDKEIPSWVLALGRPGISSFWQPKWHAAGEDSEKFNVELAASGDLNELILEGQKVDVISEMATKRPHGLKKVTMYDFDPTWPGLVLKLPQLYAYTHQTRTEALWRTICCDTPSAYDAHLRRKLENEAANSDGTAREWTTWIDHEAPETYGEQFKMTVCATILAHAERSAHMTHKIKNTTAGVLLQAMMKLQLAEEGPHQINAPSEDELTEMLDTSLNGPYFKGSAAQQAFADYEELFRRDHTALKGPGCATPSRAEIAEYLTNPYFRVWLPSLKDSKLDLSAVFGLEGREDEEADDVQGMDELPPDLNGFNTNFNRYCGGRRLFITEKQYIGLGPMSMEAGDEVWLLKGSRVPFLLRRVSPEENELDVHRTVVRSRYRYVGDLYVHGAMRGEALQGRTSWQEIVLA